jgi:hypothetical protein
VIGAGAADVRAAPGTRAVAEASVQQRSERMAVPEAASGALSGCSIGIATMNKPSAEPAAFTADMAASAA